MICTIIFAFVEKNDGLEWFLLIYAIFVFLYSFGVESVFEENFWVAKYQKTISYSKEEIEKRDKTEQVYYEERISHYNNVLIPSYNDEHTKYNNKISQKEKDLNIMGLNALMLQCQMLGQPKQFIMILQV